MCVLHHRPWELILCPWSAYNWTWKSKITSFSKESYWKGRGTSVPWHLLLLWRRVKCAIGIKRPRQASVVLVLLANKVKAEFKGQPGQRYYIPSLARASSSQLNYKSTPKSLWEVSLNNKFIFTKIKTNPHTASSYFASLHELLQVPSFLTPMERTKPSNTLLVIYQKHTFRALLVHYPNALGG